MGDRENVVRFEDDARQRAVEALGILDTPREERFDRVARLAHELFEVPMVSVTFLDGDRQFRKAEVGLGGREAPRAQSFCDAAVRGTGMLVVEDAASDPRFATNPFVVGEPNLRFYAGHPLRAPGGEQVGTLCIVDTAPRTMDPHERELLRDLAGWLQSEISRDDELDRASVVQRNLLPRAAPAMPGFEMAAINLPAGRLGGDFYDWYQVHGGMRFTVADVMGKGVGAAITAAGVRAALHTSADRDLVDAVEHTTALLDHDLTEATTFVTLFHAEIDAATGRMRFVDAGHNLVGVVRADGTWEALHSEGLPLGLSFGDRTAADEIVLAPGDAVLCCSDGLLDLLGDDPVPQILEVARTGRPADCIETVQRLADGRRPLPDDVTAVVIRHLPDDARTEPA